MCSSLLSPQDIFKMMPNENDAMKSTLFSYLCGRAPALCFCSLSTILKIRETCTSRSWFTFLHSWWFLPTWLSAELRLQLRYLFTSVLLGYLCCFHVHGSPNVPLLSACRLLFSRIVPTMLLFCYSFIYFNVSSPSSAILLSCVCLLKTNIS